MQATSNNLLGIYILTRNRPHMCQEALESVINQTYKNINIIVSDNSTNYETRDLIEEQVKKNKNCTYTHRNLNLDGVTHLNLVLLESSKYEFVMFMHDDDILMPNLAEVAVQTLIEKNQIGCVGFNSYIMRNNIQTSETFIQKKSNELIENTYEFIKNYIDINAGHPPFPSYVYRRAKIENNFFNSQFAGKYCDFTFLVNLVKKNSMFWHRKPLYIYRIHSQNDSISHEYKNLFKLMIFLIGCEPKLTPQILKYFVQYLKSYIKNIF